MIEGFKYMTTDIPGIKISAKTSITDMAIGLLIALGSWVILNTINPTLVNNTLNIQGVYIDKEAIGEISSAEYQKITGKPIKAKKEILALIDKVSKEEKIDACLVKATIASESDFNSRQIGCDENVFSAGIPSRKAFIESGVRYDGSSIPQGTSVTDRVINQKCVPNEKMPGYGLDWRFSKGIGIMQITLFPETYGTSMYTESIKKTGSLYNKKTIPPIGLGYNKNYSLKTIGEFFDDEKNIREGIRIMKRQGKDCEADAERFLKAYNGGNCSSTNAFAVNQGKVRLATYKECKAGK
jgi:hypothetical protein